MKQQHLPHVNQEGCYEMRLESIGGLGANLCGKMLGELGAMKLKLYAASFSSYGSEKRGSPVKSFIRYSEKPIGISSPVEQPDLLGLFHEAMLGKENVLQGVTSRTVVVINTAHAPKEMRTYCTTPIKSICTIDAQRLAQETKSRVNMVMLGAIGKASGFLSLQAIQSIAEETIGKKYPALLDNNLQAIQRGYEELSQESYEEKGHSTIVSSENTLNQKHSSSIEQYCYLSGGILTQAGSTVTNDLSPSREGYIPVFLQERCIHCGLCDSTCPDMVFQFSKGTDQGKEAMINRGLDYTHCKGCMRCVEICPTEALVMKAERDYDVSGHTLPNQNLISTNVETEKVGANSYVTSESYLTEKRVDGGVS